MAGGGIDPTKAATIGVATDTFLQAWDRGNPVPIGADAHTRLTAIQKFHKAFVLWAETTSGVSLTCGKDFVWTFSAAGAKATSKAGPRQAYLAWCAAVARASERGRVA